MMHNMDVLVMRIDHQLERIKIDNPYPVGASQAKSKKDAYYKGVEVGLRIVLKIIETGA